MRPTRITWHESTPRLCAAMILALISIPSNARSAECGDDKNILRGKNSTNIFGTTCTCAGPAPVFSYRSAERGPSVTSTSSEQMKDGKAIGHRLKNRLLKNIKGGLLALLMGEDTHRSTEVEEPTDSQRKPNQTMEPASRTRGVLGLQVLLCSSLLLNALLVGHRFLSTSTSPSELLGVAIDGSWALQAARDAEAVAATGCSGHGRVFLDGIVGEDGRPGCECNACFQGPDCSVRTPDCMVDANSGNPLFLEPYWMRHAEASAVVLSGWHRMSYATTDGLFQSVELERSIKQLHRAVGNAVVDDKHMVFTTGSTQLFNALVYALSPDSNSGSTASVVATPPYYRAYRTSTVLFDSRESRWDGSTAIWANASGNSTNSKDIIEFVTSPNNPDTMLYQPVVAGSSAIVDRAYFWPHFTHIPAPADDDVMLFTVSKLSGHAGSRFGWALIRDEKVAQRVNYYILQNTMGSSRDTQLRMLNVFKVMLANLQSKEDIFAFGRDVMAAKWRRLSAVVSRSRRLSLQKIPPQYCTYFNTIREPSPAYAWVKCEREEDGDCADVLLKAKIISRSGVSSEASSRYTRVSLLKSQDDFDLLLERVTELVDAENYSVPARSNSM